jgi:acetylornithine deacetylase
VSCRFLINGEPTDSRLATGTKGSIRAVITTEGRAAHSAYPEAGESAIEKLLDILQEIRASKWPEDGFFGTTTCNIGVLSGGTRPNVIADKARAELQIRLGIDIEHVKRVLEDAVGTRGRLEYSSAHNPVRLFSVPGFDECVVRFTTDVPYLSQWGKPLLLGPGSILDAHTDHERISKRELEQAIDLYLRLSKQLIR